MTLVDGTPTRQRYESETNALRATTESSDGTLQISDSMPYFMDRGIMIDMWNG